MHRHHRRVGRGAAAPHRLDQSARTGSVSWEPFTLRRVPADPARTPLLRGRLPLISCGSLGSAREAGDPPSWVTVRQGCSGPPATADASAWRSGHPLTVTCAKSHVASAGTPLHARRSNPISRIPQKCTSRRVSMARPPATSRPRGDAPLRLFRRRQWRAGSAGELAAGAASSALSCAGDLSANTSVTRTRPARGFSSSQTRKRETSRTSLAS